MPYISYKVTPDLSLFKHLPLAEETVMPPEPVEIPNNRIVVIDCSGSMGGDLPRLRDQLKRKLPKLIGEKDTLTIIWFSGKGEFGTLLEGEPIANLSDLSNVNKAIDRWLRPTGLTGFKDPMEEACRVVDRLSSKNPEAVFSLFFMSDGADNQFPKPQILSAVEKAAPKFSSATFVEYGYYADRPLLTAMAEKMGGSLIFSESFDNYAPVFESAMGRKAQGTKKIEYKVPGDVVGALAFAVDDGELLTFAVEGGLVRIPENITAFGFLSSPVEGTAIADLSALSMGVINDAAASALAYAAVSLFSTRMKPEVVLPLLKALGDVTYIDQFSGCYGKQKYSEFQDSTKIAALHSGVRLTRGYDPTKVPDDNAFTVLQLLQVLSQDEDNRLLLEHEKFQYSRIGRARLDASQILTQEEQDEVSRLTAEMQGERDSLKVAQYASKIAEITNKPAPLKFQATGGSEGYPVQALVFAEERPNVSIRVMKTGTVDVSSRCPEEYKALLPQEFPTYIYRNYSIIKDGLVNVKMLPCKVSPATVGELVSAGIPEEAMGTFGGGNEIGLFVFDLTKLPVINRSMVQATSAKKLFELEWELTESKAAQKVFKYYRDQYLGKKESVAFTKSYGKEASQWLADQGLTDFNGFNPKSVVAKSEDVYYGKEMNVKIKSFSSLPSIDAVKKKLAAKGEAGMTPSEALVYKYVKYVDAFLMEDVANISEVQKRMLDTWLANETKETVSKCRELMFQKSKLLFSVIVGQSWFSDFLSVDENSMELFLGGDKRSCSVEMAEVEISI